MRTEPLSEADIKAMSYRLNDVTITIDPVTGITLTDEQVRRGGAIDCLLALRELEKAAETITNGNDTPEEFQDKQLNEAKAFAAALGPMPPRLEGIIIAMAEYIHFATTTGCPNLDNWIPDSAMTVAERQAMIERMVADEATINVVHFPAIAERMAAR
ncbi:MAG: hypothetical protein NTY41_08455 [Proteobacteria bacterium]|nr:hypothetical protein [Pseudomonadota bacterium]